MRSFEEQTTRSLLHRLGASSCHHVKKCSGRVLQTWSSALKLLLEFCLEAALHCCWIRGIRMFVGDCNVFGDEIDAEDVLLGWLFLAAAVLLLE